MSPTLQKRAASSCTCQQAVRYDRDQVETPELHPTRPHVIQVLPNREPGPTLLKFQAQANVHSITGEHLQGPRTNFMQTNYWVSNYMAKKLVDASISIA